jgi:DNA-binding PadR family transcriptional regulator
MNHTIFQILLSLNDDPRDADGVLEAMRTLGGKQAVPALASFYRGLKKASDSGFIRVLDATKGRRRGRPRQRYQMTRSGRYALRTEARCLGAQLAISVHNCPVFADSRFPMSISNALSGSM